jgi:hypothetical protein
MMNRIELLYLSNWHQAHRLRSAANRLSAPDQWVRTPSGPHSAWKVVYQSRWQGPTVSWEDAVLVVLCHNRPLGLNPTCPG